MRGLIVAAGEGKRMRPITYWRPKPLVPIADAPLIVHILRGFVAAGVREICIVIGHLRDQMREALGDGSAWGASIHYVVQEQPTGTGSAVLLARDFLGDDPFMLSWGDILVPPSHYRRVAEAFGPGVDGVLSLNPVDDPWEGAAVYVNEGLVSRIVEKPERGASATNFNNAGIFVLPGRILDLTAALPPSSRGEVELPQAIDRLLQDGARLRAVEVEGYWSDVARPGTVLSINGHVVEELGGGSWVSASAEVHAEATLVPPVYLAAGVRISAGATVGANVSLHAGTIIGASATVSNAVLLVGCSVGEDSRLDWCYAEDDAVVPPGAVLPGRPDLPFILPPCR
jgi:NDP-sugar pyrophosphorylase family protein